MHTMTPSERNFSPGTHVAIERLSTSYCNLMRTVLYCKATLAGSSPTGVSFGLSDCLLPVSTYHRAGLDTPTMAAGVSVRGASYGRQTAGGRFDASAQHCY